MRMSKGKLLGAALLATALVVGCTAQVRDINDVAVLRDDGVPITLDQMQQVIRNAAARQGWQKADLVQPGHFVITKREGYKSESVDLLYTASDFSIHYKDSQGLRYHPTPNTIAHSYKSDINDLRDEIVDEVARSGASRDQ